MSFSFSFNFSFCFFLLAHSFTPHSCSSLPLSQSNASLDKVIGTLRERIEKFHSDVKAARQHCNQQESAIECFKSDIQCIVPVILDPTELRAEVGKLAAAHDAQGGLKPWLDADVEVQALFVTSSFLILYSSSSILFLHSFLLCFPAVHSRQCNKMTYLSIMGITSTLTN